MGVASAMHGHLQQKMDSIAVMKCIGARSAQVIRIYTVQTLLLGLSGGVLGAAFGVGVAAAFPGMIAKYFTIDVQQRVGRLAGAAGHRDRLPDHAAVHGAAAAGDPRHPPGAGIPPRYGWRRTAPALRAARSGSRAARSCWAPARSRARSRKAAGAIAVRTGAFFTLALAHRDRAALARGLGLPARCCVLRRAKGLPAAVRHGIANLYRPGSQAQAAVVALGVGVMFTLTVFLVQDALVRQIRGSAPPGMPNVFLLDIPGTAAAGALGSDPGAARRERPRRTWPSR